MIYQIKRTNGSVEWLLKEVKPTGTQSREAMGADVVDMSFTLPVYVDFKIGDFVDVYGQRYVINLTPTVDKKAKRQFEYNIQFEASWYDLAKVQYQFLNPLNNLLEPIFDLMGNAATFIDLLVQNANRHSAGWTVGVVDDTEYVNLNFSTQNCLQVLHTLASQFETEFWIENKTIHLQKREQSSGYTFEYGKGNGLYNIRRQNKSSANIFTRLYVRGGSSNLPTGYGSNSLLLPNGATYIQDNAKVALYGLIEASQIFENIFPQREGTVTGVIAGDDNWRYFTDSAIDFDINAQASGLDAKVTFNTGQLAGYTFTINNYNHATKQFSINKNDDETALNIPSNLLRPQVGDKYVLIDIVMPQTYVTNEENRLLTNAQAYYDQNSDPKFLLAYSATCDPLFIGQNNIAVTLGNTAILLDGDLGINTELRISKYTRDLQNGDLYPSLEWSDTIGANEIIRQYQQQKKTLQMLESSGLLDVNQMRKNLFLNRLSAQDGYLLLSGIKIKSGLADLATRALRADLADYAIDSDKWDGRQFDDYLNQSVRTTDDVRHKSITSTNFVSGYTGNGWKVDEQGNATFDNLTVRKQFNVYELVLNKISGTNGALAVTDTIKIATVTETQTGYDCTIETDNNTIAVPFQIDDLLRCQIWNGASIKYYFVKVTAVGNGTFSIDKATKVGAGIPTAGDVVVRFGNVSNVNRQGLLYLTASDTNAPYLDVLDGVTSDNLTGKTKVRLGRLDGITDADLGDLSGYGLYGQNVFVKGKIVVTGGNAQTIAGSQALANTAKAEAITEATTQASADATIKASSAQVAAIQVAANDASNRINALKFGGRNLIINSKQTLTIIQAYSSFALSEPLIVGETYTATLCGIRGDGASFGMFGTQGNEFFVGFGSLDGLQIVSNTFVYGGIYGGHSNVRVYSEHSINPSTFYWAKIEKGNKATDWTPAPEDGISYADQKALSAQTAAQNFATAQAAYEREIAKAYADGIVDAEEARAIADASNKLAEAKADATIKVNEAQAAAAGYTDTKSQSTLTAAQTYADNSAQSKANVAQANAVAIASTDAQAKADAAKAEANLLSQQLVNAVKLGSRNLVKLSKQTITGTSQMQVYYLSEPLIVGETYTATLNGISGVGATFQIWVNYANQAVVRLSKTDGIDTVSNTFVYAGNANEYRISVYSEVTSSPSTVHWIKIEKGNKATDWTPAPEDVQAAIDLAKATADAANASYATLTASLKSLAYQDVVELSKLGSTVIENGMIKTALLDANYIKSNVVNAAYINALDVDAGAIKSGTIDSARINANQIIVNGGGATTSQAQAYANAAQANAISTAATDVNNKITAIQVGGRNILLNTAYFTNTLNWLNAEVNGIHFDGSQSLRSTNIGSGTRYNPITLKPNTIYTFSCQYYKAGNEVPTSQFPLWVEFSGIGGIWGGSYWINSDQQTVKDDWAKCSVTFKTPPHLVTTYLYLFDPTATNQPFFTYVKLEQGNKASDWTPAPEEVKADAQSYADVKSQATLTAAQTYADNSAQSKANVAQANAVAIASTDAQAKADAAKAEANLLSQQLVNAVKLGSRNLVKLSKQTITGTSQMQVYYLSEPLIVGETYTATLNGISGVGAAFRIWVNYASQSVVGLTKTDGVDTVSNVFVYAGNANEYRISVYSEVTSSPSTVHWIKIEKGNKATDWTPAPEDVQAAIDLAKATADAANASYATLTANLKSMAYQDVVELSKLGSTVIENGMIKTTLLDANYIKSNIVNASYITALDIVATKVAATQGFIGGFNIVNQSLIAGSNSDNPSGWDLNSSNIKLYTGYQLYRKIGGTTNQTDEMSVNLGYYPATSGLLYKDTLVLKNNIRNTAQDYLPPSSLNGSGAVYRQKNRALILEAKNSDENIAMEVMSGHVYLRGVNDAGTLNALRDGYIKYVNMGGWQVLVLNNNPTELNTGIPDAQGLFWNDAQTGYATHGGCTGYDPQYGYEVGSEHQYTVPAHTYSSTVSKALANNQALTEAQNQAQYEADNYGYCYYQ